ncbi:MAG TPA: shikimate kinase [Selenomonadales bacterium]|nr:shikimate kinase [Selenomonadales bacterium]
MKNVVLIGFMGVGKTSTGRLLAARLGKAFIDIDRKIETECGASIAELFAEKGESFFRDREREVISRVSRLRNAVIATGGGAVANEENMRKLRESGIIISLVASIATILERTGRRNSRPLLNRPDREEYTARLYARRQGLYQTADLIIDTSEISPHQVVDIIVAFLRRRGYIHGRC